MGRTVLVTGVSLDLGGALARLLAADPAVERVIGVDVVPPRRDLGAVDFVRADIRNPVIAKVIAGRDVDTVVHMSVQAAGHSGGRSSVKEHNVIGTMQLLAACQKAPGLERLVVRSSSEVYGSSSRDPAMFTEEMTAKRMPRAGFGKDVLEVEGYVRGFARRRPDVSVTTLRAAPVVGARVRSPLADYLRLPVVPTPLGYDARLQFVHEDDLLAALRHATLDGVHGTFNVAGEGILMLSQAVRRLGRPSVSMPGFAIDNLGALLAPLGGKRIDRDLLGYLSFGRGLDTDRLHHVLGFRPEHDTAATFEDFARSVTPGMVPPARAAVGLLAPVPTTGTEVGRG